MHRRLGHSNYDGKIAGLYDLEETLGRGHFAVVKLARHVFTGEKVAVKVIDKSKLDEVSRSHLFQEVRCMKLVQHPNVVRLYEVIDTQTKLYLILELGDGGDLYDYIMRHDSGLSEEVARTYFRQIVRAISYCHRLHVVHRDLKPENVVFFEKLGTVKLTDFGFSNRFCPGQKLETSCGSLAYSAPEILLGDSYDAPAVDVWSLGVILYMLVCGQAPFQEANDSETLTMIMDCKYSIPAHVSDDCKRLIARMLVRKPEGRATLEEIAADVWLAIGTDLDPVEALPLVSRQQVSEEHHNLIITKMVNGNIATKEDILEALDKNEYNHITATYFLLAERKLRAHRQEQVQKTRPELLDVSSSRQHDMSINDIRVDPSTLTSVNQSLLTVPRTPGDVPQNSRTRKCSIVQEEEDEDDVSSCSGRDEHGNVTSMSSFNRRGSRSEGKLSHVLQERLSQLPEKTSQVVGKLPLRGATTNRGEVVKSRDETSSPGHTFTVVKVGNIETSSTLGTGSPTKPSTYEIPRSKNFAPTVTALTVAMTKKPLCTDIESRPRSVTDCLAMGQTMGTNKWRVLGQNRSLSASDKERMEKLPKPTATTTTTTILTESSTAPSPLRTFSESKNDNDDEGNTSMKKYATMPASSSIMVSETPGQLPLNEILEDSDIVETSGCEIASKYRIVRRSGYEQRRSKFHKARTTSCSSSDASDDDSEGRKKRANKLGATSSKPLPSRRDSHDDSSDSQDPGGSGNGAGGGGGNRALGNGDTVNESTNPDNRGNENSQGDGTTTTTTTTSTTTTTTMTNGGKINRCTDNQGINFGRRHRAGRRRAGETRLRESQSLNRITEVQEAEPPANHHIPRHSTNPSVSSSSSSSSSVAKNITCNVANPQQNFTTVQRAKGFGARLLQSMSIGKSTSSGDAGKTNGNNGIRDIVRRTIDRRGDDKFEASADGDEKKTTKCQNNIANQTNQLCDNTRGPINRNECKSRKMRLLSRYFAVHKKLCVPLPGIFGKGRLYKARSCSNITRDRVSPPSPKSMLLCGDDKWRERKQWCDINQQQQNHHHHHHHHHHHRGSDGDINQNLGLGKLMHDNVVGKGCVGLPTICHIHLGDASKCCSLC